MPSIREKTKRDQILDRSLALFFERGISSLSMEAIASCIGVSKVTLYKYYPGKELLGSAAIGRLMDRILERFDAIDAGPGTTFPERFQASLAAIEEILRPAIPVLMRDIISEAPWLWTKIQALRAQKIFPRMAGLLAEGKNLGYIRDDLDDFVAGSLIMAMVEQIAQPSFLFSLPIPPSQALQVVIRVLLGGILSDEGRRLLREFPESTHSPVEEQ